MTCCEIERENSKQCLTKHIKMSGVNTAQQTCQPIIQIGTKYSEEYAMRLKSTVWFPQRCTQVKT